MKRFWPLFAMTMVLPATVFAGNDCHYIGSWFGYNGDGEIASGTRRPASAGRLSICRHGPSGATDRKTGPIVLYW